MAARLAPVFFVAAAAAILLAQYRAILVSALLAVLFVAVLLGLVRVRGALAGVLVAITFIAALSAIPSIFPELKFQDTISSITGEPGVYINARVNAGSDIPAIYSDEPAAAVIGAGPGAVNSRRGARTTGRATAAASGWRSRSSSATLRPIWRRNTRFRDQLDTGAINGSYVIANPFASYYALLAEVGIIGFVLMLAIYGRALLDSTRMSLTALRNAPDGDPLPGLMLASTVGFFVIIQLAILDNWWEVTRLTFILWAVFAVATKEFEARYGDVTPEQVIAK